MHKNIIFLWDREFAQTNGLFVELSRNVVILGSEFINKSQNGQYGASMNKHIRDKLVGKTIVITGGKWKSYRGRVIYCDDKEATIELSSKCMKISIDKTLIQEVDLSGELQS